MANPVLTRQFGDPAASDAALQTAPPAFGLMVTNIWNRDRLRPKGLGSGW
jgi:hypothetical protein